MMESSERFAVTDAASAGWAIRKLKAARAQFEDYKNAAQARVEEIQRDVEKEAESLKQTEDYFSGLLRMYFNTLPEELIRRTQTLDKYKLPDGMLKVKHVKPSIVPHRDAALEWAKANHYEALIKTTEDIDWKTLKSHLSVDNAGNVILDETGEIVDFVSVDAAYDEFIVE